MSKIVKSVGMVPLFRANALSLQQAAASLSGRAGAKYEVLATPAVAKLVQAAKLDPAQADSLRQTLKALNVSEVSNFPGRGKQYEPSEVKFGN